jgi:hypothetical protein
MAMTIAESLAFVRDFQGLAGDLPERVDVIICPPFTALWPVAQAVASSGLQLGAQDMAAASALNTPLACSPAPTCGRSWRQPPWPQPGDIH